MAFGRIVELLVADPGQLNQHKTPRAPVVGVDVSQLDIEFEVQRSNKFTQNTATIRVYNADKDTRTKLLIEGANVLLRAGYQDQESVGVIFLGNVSAPAKSERQEDGTWVTTLKAAAVRADEKPLEETLVSLSYAPKIPLQSVVQELADAQGLALNWGVGTILLDNGWAYAGKIRGAFDYIRKILKSNGSGLYLDNGELVVYSLIGNSTYQAAFLDYDSGLIGVDVQPIAPTNDKIFVDESGKKYRPARAIRAQCLLNAAIRPNSIVVVDTPEIKGNFVVQKVKFTGDNFGGSFDCELEGAEWATT